MKIICFLFLFAMAYACSPEAGVADTATTEIVSSGNPTAKIIIKTLQVNFEPAEVLLLEEREEGKLGSVPLSFRVLKDKADGATSANSLVVVVGAASSESRPLAILLRANPDSLEYVDAGSAFIEPGDLVDLSVIEPMKEKILESRSQFVALKQELTGKQEKVRELKSKAASITRINRLVEAQTTAASLTRKLEGLKSDRANISLLLEIIAKQQNSARLVSKQAALSRDLRLLSEEGAGAKNQKGVLLSDARREAANQVIEKARGLDLEKLREQLQLYRKDNFQDESKTNDGSAYLQNPEL